jgi:Tfp pilus assembly protein PilF
VANVLEGSVRTAGDKVRITAQLIRASDSSHVWSQTYDREMTDVFKVQDEIASAVVGQLKVTLLGAAPTVHATDPKAYALFLRGREVGRQYNAAAFEQALGLLREALAIDPTYAPAWTQISMVHVGQIDLGLLAPANGIAESHEVLKQAIAHDPAYAPAYAQLALIEGVLERNYSQAAQDLGRALTLDPTNSDIIGAASIFARRLGRMALAITLAQRQVAQDPVNPDGFDSLALAYRYNGQLDKCLEAYRTVLSLTPDTGWTHAAIGSVLLEQGRPEAALAEFQKEPVEEYRLSGSSAAYYLMGRRPEADAMLAELLQKFGDTRPYIIAMVLATRGDKDRAFAMLEKSGELNELDLGAIPVVSAFDTLHDDPRWLPLLRKLGLAPEQLDSIKFDVTVPQ